MKRFWRCRTCGDVHFGENGPAVCPTCETPNDYVPVGSNEGKAMMSLKADLAGRDIRRKEFRSNINLFLKGRPYILNPDLAFTDPLIDGVLSNEESTGYKYCPCRMKETEMDPEPGLVCPCHFESQQAFLDKGECWCGLFVTP